MPLKKGTKVFLIVGGILALAFFLFNARAIRIVSIYAESSRLRSDIERLKTENQLLRDELEVASKDSDYQEFLARRDLELISDGEIQYYFGKGKAKDEDK
ncbi:MAG: septum formation initiator family protein [Endomicrobiales bacterium]|nr:septum formation initiator family protein [Endomicrobiales bacterium]